MGTNQQLSEEGPRRSQKGAAASRGGRLVVPIATALIDGDGRILHWSDEAEALLGYTAREAVGEYAARLLVTEEQRPGVLTLYDRILSGVDWSGKFPVLHRDGHHVDLEFLTHPLSGPGGRPLVLAVAADVRALHRVEGDLAVLDGYFAQSPIGLAVHDTELRLVRINAALERIHGVPARDHLGRRHGEVLPDLDTDLMESAMRQVLESGEPATDVLFGGRTPADPDHDHVWTAAYFRLEDPAGQVLGVCASVIDVTARFEAEAQAGRAQERLKLLAEATSRISATLDLHRIAKELAETLVPRIADLSGVFLLERLIGGEGAAPQETCAGELLRRLASACGEPDSPAAELPVDRVYRIPTDSPFAEVIATGRSVELAARDLSPLAPGTTERLATYMGPQRARVVPLVARGTVMGLVVYAPKSSRGPFDEQDVTLADELVSRAAVSIINARLYRQEHETALARQQALKEANTARERLAVVNEASRRIGTTLDVAQTARELAEVAAPRLADIVVVEVLDSLVQGEAQEPAQADGYAVLRRVAFHRVAGVDLDPVPPLGDVGWFDASTPYAWSLAESRPVLIPCLDEAGEWLDADPHRAAALRAQGVGSLMVVPLIARGTALGVASFYRVGRRRPFDEDDLALAGELVSRAAVCIDNARLYTSERDAARARQQALEEAHEAHGRLALLNEASGRIGTSLDVERTAQELVDVVVPRFADMVTVDLLDSALRGEEPLPLSPDLSVRMRAVAVGEAYESGMVGTADKVGRVSEFDSAKIYTEGLRSRRTVVIPEVDEAAMHQIVSSPERVAPILRAGVHSYLMVPLLARGLVLGGAEFIRMRNPEPFTPADVALAEELVARAAVSIDNARLYRRERATALTLQRSLLPQDVHRTLGLEIAYRYQPSSVVSEVGGDWFDVVPLSCARVALIVGDVMGHGIRAAATMGQIRTAARTLVTLDMPPEQVLARLDETTAAIGEGQFATCVCAVYDPVDRSCTVACAGHPPPVVATPDGSARLVDLPPGLPLGVGGARFESVEFTLPEQAILTLYTDGLVEQRGQDIDQGLSLLQQTVADRRPTLELTCDAVLSTLVTRDAEDDIAVIMAQVLPVPKERMATLTLTGDTAMVSTARQFTRATLDAWGLSALSEFAALLVSELVTNALLHAGAPRQLRLFRDRVLTVEVADADRTTPRLRRATQYEEGGRGMHLVNELAHRWGSRSTRQGKVVWFEMEAPLGLLET